MKVQAGTSFLAYHVIVVQNKHKVTHGGPERNIYRQSCTNWQKKLGACNAFRNESTLTTKHSSICSIRDVSFKQHSCRNRHGNTQHYSHICSTSFERIEALG